MNKNNNVESIKLTLKLRRRKKKPKRPNQIVASCTSSHRSSIGKTEIVRYKHENGIVDNPILTSIPQVLHLFSQPQCFRFSKEKKKN